MSGYVWIWDDNFDYREYKANSLGEILTDFLIRHLEVDYDDIQIEDKGNKLIAKCHGEKFTVKKSVQGLKEFFVKQTEKISCDEFEIYD